MKIKTQDSKNLDIADTAFGVPYNEALVHQITTAYMAGGRSGSKAQKNRSAVSGGGAKPWKQKGTGKSKSRNYKKSFMERWWCHFCCATTGPFS